jgi:hypothetical protein
MPPRFQVNNHGFSVVPLRRHKNPSELHRSNSSHKKQVSELLIGGQSNSNIMHHFPASRDHIKDFGPSVVPLDYPDLIENSTVSSELARTLDDLSQWLSVIELNLTGVLDNTFSDVIEEEDGYLDSKDKVIPS